MRWLKEATMWTRAAGWFTALTVGSVLATGAIAHPGGGGGMGGGGMGMGGGGMGPGVGMDHGMAGSSPGFSNPGFGSSNERSSVGAHSPTSTLDNSSLDNALSKALAKSGVTVPGGDLKTACAGFKNLGSCIAALHVANNLDLPGGFTALKGLTTGPSAISLGKAIQQLQPNTDAGAQEKQANRQAKNDLNAADEAQSRS